MAYFGDGLPCFSSQKEVLCTKNNRGRVITGGLYNERGRIFCAPKSTINDNESHLNEKWQLQCENSAPITFLRGSKLSAHQKSFTAQMAPKGVGL
jgi:hypothetical protein